MKKSSLASLLAIPVFSFAGISNSLNAAPNPYPITQENQKIKTATVAASVIDFLLGTKILGDIGATEEVALGILGDLFETQGQREHEIDYATAGRNQFIINVADGRQAQLVQDEIGNVYLLMEGVIHPLAQEFINQARNISIEKTLNIENATLSPYNLGDLERRFNSGPTKEISQFYRVFKGGEYLSEIMSKFGVPASNISKFNGHGALVGGQHDPSNYWGIGEKRILNNKAKLPGGRMLYIIKEDYENEISAVFSYKWWRDLNNNEALDFNEINQIKRTFYENEDINIGAKYQTAESFIGDLEIKILKENTGELLAKNEMNISSNGSMVCQHVISAGTVPVGKYVIYTNLIDYMTLNTVSSKSEKFEIIERKNP
ncbi:MAG TPA: hypothetical protein VMV95_00010 [Bacillota bacterium]|nr:hypothetical protein [Bacillota bacterium]